MKEGQVKERSTSASQISHHPHPVHLRVCIWCLMEHQSLLVTSVILMEVQGIFAHAGARYLVKSTTKCLLIKNARLTCKP